VFQPECRLVAVNLPQGGMNDEKKQKQFLAFFKVVTSRKQNMSEIIYV
jgi:hypothetical protein